MQVEGNRFHRVKAVAEMLDVSQNTIYRAIEAGKLRAAKFGEGKGALRVPAAALADYIAACQQNSADVRSMSSSQADGLAVGEFREVA